MGEQKTPQDRLDTWKGISDYLGRDVRTVSRWEKEKGLPVRRVPGGQRQAVFAYRHEIDEWLNGAGNVDDVPPKSVELFDASASVLVAPSFEPLPTSPVRDTARWSRSPYLIALISVALVAALFTYQSAEARNSLSGIQLTDLKQLTANGREKDHLLLAGSHLYFGQEQEGWYALADMPVAGGEIRTLWNPQMNVLPEDISPDGKQLLVRAFQSVGSEDDLWIVPLNGGQPHQLPNSVGRSAAWSPDGRLIAYATGNKIFLTSSDGETIRQLASFADVPDVLRWSADGHQLRFVLLDSSTMKPSYWELSSGDSMVTTSLHAIPLPVAGFINQWSRTSTKDDNILFGNHDNPTTGLLMHHGHNWWERPVSMVNLSAGLGQTTAAALDDTANRLYLLSRPPARIVTLRFDPRSQEYRRVLIGISAQFIDYSRDGAWITFTSPDDESLWMARSDGTELQQLSLPSPGHIELPRWSPDGKSVAYMLTRPGHPWRIFIAPRDGGMSKEASDGNDNQGAPTWSPDGKFLVYGNVECEATHSCAIHQTDLSTGKTKTLPGSEGLATARWSPDGKFVAAMRPATHELLLYSTVTEKWRLLAKSMNGPDLNWSGDSRSLYSNLPGADARIVRVSVPDGKTETVIHLRSQDDVNLAQAPDIGFSVAPDGAILLQRSMNSEEIYAYTLRR